MCCTKDSLSALTRPAPRMTSGNMCTGRAPRARRGWRWWPGWPSPRYVTRIPKRPRLTESNPHRITNRLIIHNCGAARLPAGGRLHSRLGRWRRRERPAATAQRGVGDKPWETRGRVDRPTRGESTGCARAGLRQSLANIKSGLRVVYLVDFARAQVHPELGPQDLDMQLPIHAPKGG